MSQFADVTILLDRSGSMQALRQSVVDGVNAFVRKVNADPGEGFWTLLTFDDPDSAAGAGEDFPRCVFTQKREYEVPLLEAADLVPRGGTALRDALCLTVRQVRAWYLSRPEAGRPKVMIVVMTDGLENRSRQFSGAELRALVAEVQARHGFEFVFLGANMDAFAEASQFGITKTSSAYLTDAVRCGRIAPATTNVMNYAATPEGAVACLADAGELARSWKADGNQSGEALLSSALPDQLRTEKKS